jgi:hypothetical protein
LFGDAIAIPQSGDVTEINDAVKAAFAERSHYRGATLYVALPIICKVKSRRLATGWAPYFDAREFQPGCGVELSPVEIASPLNGGAGFAGKSGRKTANVCDTNAMETTMNTAAHFMSAALSRLKWHGK